MTLKTKEDIKGFNPRSCTRSDTDGLGKNRKKSSFNPRSCTRSDYKADFMVLSWEVSIHAPVQGATEIFSQTADHVEFQSTLLYKERHKGNRR